MSELFSSWFYKSYACGKYGMRGTGRKMKKIVYCWKKCKLWWCKSCGARGGAIHRARKRRLYEVWGKITQKNAARHFVFSVPESERYLFQKKGGPSSLHHMVKRILQREFPDEPSIQSFQGFGDKDPSKWHPHGHVATKPALGSKLKLPPEKLDRLRALWAKALRGYGCRITGEVDVHYSYARGVERVKHVLKYLVRPCPGPTNAAALANNPDLLYFLTDTLHRFKWIRYYRWPKPVAVESDESADELQGYAALLGEEIDWEWGVKVSRTVFDIMYLPSEYTELAPGFFVINGS